MASHSSQFIASSSSQQTVFSAQNLKDRTDYLQLYKAILKGDLNSVRNICDSDQHALEARITVNLDTALHVAVGTGRANHIVEYLLTKMSTEKVALQNFEGNTVLSIAAIVGNVQAAKMIMKKTVYLSLNEVANNDGWIPLMEAARHGRKEMIKYLLQFSDGHSRYVAATLFENKSGVFFINLLIIAGYYDLALDLVKHHPSLASVKLSRGESLLCAIAGKPSAFPSGRGRKSKVPLHIYISKIPSYIKEIRETKLMHQKALQLVKLLCSEVTKLDHQSASLILTPPLLLAAELGVYEVVEEIISSFPDAVWFSNDKNHNVLHLAVMNRRERVFNLVFQMSGHRHLLLMSQDIDGNNILHLAGKLAPRNQLMLIPGAALQMQRELQWFKEVENIVQPSYREDKNAKDQKTPVMVFTEEHEELVKDGEKWMKDAASSSSVAAALIATVTFAAAITVPGGNQNDGKPNFYQQAAFNIFGVSNALSLFSSIGAIIMFLSILTARYAEDDFLYVLPKRIILGLVMLFLSITSMMVAFGATVYLVFSESDRKAYWIIGLVSATACLPVSLFASSQYPLLLDLVRFTYGPGIFGKQSETVLY